MNAVLWLAVAVPALAALVVRLAPRGDRALAVAGAAAAAVPAVAVLADAASGGRTRTAFTWLPAGDLDVGLRLDPLGGALSATVALVGLLVVVHATGAFAHDARRRSGLAGLLAFLAAMQGLVLAEGFLTLLVFWELVGAASARLIAFHRDDPRAAPGAVRAFLVTRGGDVGLYVALLALFTTTGGLAFDAVRPDGALGVLVAVGLIVAAIGKSAQAPLQTWLMGAMAGPAPVSALLHSATMVAAGVVLLMRAEPLLAGWPLEVVGWVGALTAVVSGAIALVEDDIKRVLAGSTSSQLGLMLVGLAAGGVVVALFHLVAHAAGKACLFLSVGVLEHERGSTELDDLRGAGREDRPAFACFAVGALSVAAVPPLAGFWSKEHVTSAAEHELAWFVLVLVAAALAAAYLLRPALVLFSPSAAAARASAAGRTAMLAGAAPLAAACVALALAGGPLKDLVGGKLPSSWLSLGLSLLALAAGAAAVLAGRLPATAPMRAVARAVAAGEPVRSLAARPALALARVSDAVDRRLDRTAVDGAPAVALTASRVVASADALVIDRAVDGTARGTVRSAGASDALERRGIDAAVDGLAHLIGRGGGETRRLHAGRLHEYLRDTALGLAAVAVLIVLAAVL